MKLYFILVLLILHVILSALLWPYAINTWLVFAGKAPAMLWWHGILMGLVPAIGQLAIPVAAVTWIAMLFLQ